jgi:hypothetical protein
MPDRPARHRVRAFQRIEYGTLRHEAFHRDGDLRLDLRQRSQWVWQGSQVSIAMASRSTFT